MELLTIKEASLWASKYLKKDITTSNISYLIQYGKIKKYGSNGVRSINKNDLITYYKNFSGRRVIDWNKRLGEDVNWALSFDYLKEKDTTKHIHRIHPYKGKFIPQLVEYFLDDHTDTLKQDTYFKKGDIILDPFCGSGTTLVQANELNIHAIGIDISIFNTLIANVKISKVDFDDLNRELNIITNALKQYVNQQISTKFEHELIEKLNQFNKINFPSPEFKIKVQQKEIDEGHYVIKKEEEIIKIYNHLKETYNLKIYQDGSNNFLKKWYLIPIQQEITFMFEQLKKVKHPITKKIISIILSRTMRSCRATTHADLATLKHPITKPYYCKKHGKICKPLFSTFSWWKRYSKDTIKRFFEFDALKTNTYQYCLHGDARTIDIFSALNKHNAKFYDLVKKQKIKGVFSSPPYVGLIDYHEQHAYAYDVFGFKRYDESEIGPLRKGQGKIARISYVNDISCVLNNIKPYLSHNYDVFMVANDKYNLYPTIAQKANMKIVKQYKRPVLNRTEKDTQAYSEIIFHLKEK